MAMVTGDLRPMGDFSKTMDCKVHFDPGYAKEVLVTWPVETLGN